ncbi:sulfite exporter TauE/SafE family protein [Halorientalis regularis]|uniref:Probable membrane transporter protein n=1 Tax=Halorientalis regularis TaxID=660518 RepID=A0A1G7IT25_9EURY|nr:sulfite exporter TauE/SafE family protein [Halorientalis regularis]SDF15459.1 hypothetical protein SAMN05216218_10462 [Halorientalis regularis]
MAYDVTTLALVFAAVFAGGLVTGVTGFGYAIVATATLASLLEPRTAIVVVILPILAANLSLVTELDRAGLRSCVRRFWAFVAAGAVGTVAGMVALTRIPAAPLSAGLGLFTLGYVAVSQPWIALPGQRRFESFCLVETHARKGLLGVAAGLVFGASNVGVQVVAYLRSLDLDHETFVGVVAMIFLGVGTVRVATAWLLGLYGSSSLLAVSAAAAVPGLVGVTVGKRLRPMITPRRRNAAVYTMLLVIGVRLAGAGLAGL